MDPSQPPNELIMHLLAEKDRLLQEKDGLVESKNRLWMEMHAIAEEKDGEIRELRQANNKLSDELELVKGQATELAKALQERMDAEEEHELEAVDGDESPQEKAGLGHYSARSHHIPEVLSENELSKDAPP